jgi:16S rRNA processing protein RimM
LSGPGILAGVVGRAHGLDGSFYLSRATPHLLAVGAKVMVDGRSLQVVRQAGLPRRPIVRLEGVDDRAAAEALLGMDVTVDADDVPALAEGEWWAHDLEGCDVYDGSTPVGRVMRLLELPSCEVLEVQRESAPEPLLVPMVRDAVRSIEVGRRRIDVDLSFLGEPWR